MKKIQGYAAGFFIFAVSVLGVISILGVWNIFSGDVITKSFETLGLLGLVAVIVMIAAQFIDAKHDGVIYVPNPGWKSMRKGTLGLLIVSVSVLALLGVLDIWDVITNQDVLNKSLSSIFIIAFVSFIIVITCRQMEGDFSQTGNPPVKM